MSIIATLKKQLTCEPLLSANHIVVAYSGGVDSHVLLHGLRQLQLDVGSSFILSAIHIHHGLSDNADHWQAHCQQACEALGVEFQSAPVKVQVAPRKSLEAQARDARYKMLIELAPANSTVVLGQHQDDQLETFLIQLKRGAGPKGLSAMDKSWIAHNSSTESKSVAFFRPLLDVSQHDILAYAQQHQLFWCEDESNQNTDFDRNFLRHKVLPVLQDRWPNISKTVSRSALLCAEQQHLLDEISAEKLQHLKATDNSLNIPALKQLSQGWVQQIVRYWLSELGIQSPPMVVMQKLHLEVLHASEDASPILQWQTWQFRRFEQQLFVVTAKPEKTAIKIIWQQQASIDLPNNLGRLSFTQNFVKPQKITQLIIDNQLGPVSICSGGYSIRFKPQGSPHSKPLKQWFKQWKIAPWLRDSVLMVIQNEQVLGLFIQGQCIVADPIHTEANQDSLWLIELEHD